MDALQSLDACHSRLSAPTHWEIVRNPFPQKFWALMVLPPTSFFLNRWSLTSVFPMCRIFLQAPEQAKIANVCRRNVFLFCKAILSLSPPLKAVPVWGPLTRQRKSLSTFQLAHTILTIRTGRRPVRDNPFSLGPLAFWLLGKVFRLFLADPSLSSGTLIMSWLSQPNMRQTGRQYISEYQMSNHNNNNYKMRNVRYKTNAATKCSWMHSLRSDDRAKSDVTACHQTSECQTLCDRGSNMIKMWISFFHEFLNSTFKFPFID